MISNVPLQHTDSAPEFMHNYTRHTIERILMSKGIQRDCGSWVDYECAKRAVFKGERIDHNDYERVNMWIIDYVGV